MSIRSQFAPMVETRLVPQYTLIIGEGENPLVREGMSRSRAAYYIRLAKACDRPVKVVLDGIFMTSAETQKCFGCLARSAQWEADCDGWGQTSECGSDQCKRSEAVAMRDLAEEMGRLG